MKRTKLLFATDVHGSEKCFRKFINLGKRTKVDVLILGGDITGKVIVPIVRQADGKFTCDFLGQKRVVNQGSDLEELEKLVRFSGYYPYTVAPNEVDELTSNPDKTDDLFKRVMMDTLHRWIRWTEESLNGTNIECYMTGGNDDLLEVETVLKSSNYIKDPEGQVVEVAGSYEMISCGYSNPTPWRTPREVSEDELANLIDGMAVRVKNMDRAIFNIHVPPFDSTIDMAPKLDTSVYPPKPHHVGTQVIMEPVGSTAVRRAIEKYSPLLGLHGHIHESKGAVKIGRALCLNPGSEYAEGTIQFVLTILADGKVEDYQFGSG